MNEPDYGARLRALADHLETVPDTDYKYSQPPSAVSYEGPDGGACALAHGYLASIIPDSLRDGLDLWCEDLASQWFGFQSFKDLEGKIEPWALQERLTAINSLRAYADAHYPITNKREGIPQSVRDIFQPKRVAA